MRSFRRTAAVTIAVFASQPAPAAPAPLLPAPIAKQLSEMAAQCKEVSGQRGSPTQDAITRADLNGDGIADYVFQESAYDCPGAISLFAGTAATGNPISVYTADRSGGVRRVWSGGVGDWSVKPRAGKPTLFVTVICEPAHSKRAIADWKWCDKRLLPNPGPGAWVTVPK